MSHVSVHSLTNLSSQGEPAGGPCSVCPGCGDPYIGGPGCYAEFCAATCGDPGHEPGDCDDRCYNPHLYV